MKEAHRARHNKRCLKTSWQDKSQQRKYLPRCWCETLGTTRPTKGSLILISGLIVVLALWRWSEGSLSVDNIQTKKAETFYWVAILFSNTLGTAAGDFLADSSGLGFLGGAALIAGLLALIVGATFFTQINRVLLFWLAFVLTRPFGATFGDLLTKTHDKGGLDFGTAGSSLILAALLIFFVVFTIIRDARALHTPSPNAQA